MFLNFYSKTRKKYRILLTLKAVRALSEADVVICTTKAKPIAEQIAMISPLFVIDFANAFKPCIGSKDKQVIRKPEANRTKRVS